MQRQAEGAGRCVAREGILVYVDEWRTSKWRRARLDRDGSLSMEWRTTGVFASGRHSHRPTTETVHSMSQSSLPSNRARCCCCTQTAHTQQTGAPNRWFRFSRWTWQTGCSRRWPQVGCRPNPDRSLSIGRYVSREARRSPQRNQRSNLRSGPAHCMFGSGRNVDGGKLATQHTTPREPNGCATN